MLGRWRELSGELIAWASALMVPLLIVGALLVEPLWNPLIQLPTQHFYVVSTVSLLSLIFSAIVLIAAVRLADRQMELMALGFLGLAGIFSVHGLATPGFLLATPTPAVGVSARLAFFVAAICFGAGAVPARSGLGRWLARWQRAIRIGLPVLIAGYLVLGLTSPAVLGMAPVTLAVLGWPLTIVTVGLLTYAAARFIRDYTLARLPMQAAFIFGLLLLADSALIIQFGEVWRLSWWAYHVLMLVGFLLLVAGLVLEYGRGGSLQDIFGGTFVHDPKTSLERGYTEGVRALISAIEVKHPYTRGHADRVTEIALLIARELRLPSDRQRIVALGGILHDIGKIGVPDAILNKPDRLTADEFEIIKRHPVQGDDLVSPIRSLRVAREVVRHHHEWVNGRGYPDGRAIDDLSLEARIIAVADTFEALTSRRSYREAFDREAANQILREEAGTHLDPEVVAAWLRIADTWVRAPRPRVAPAAPAD